MTQNQARLFSYIQRQLLITGVSPSYNEMAAHMGVGRSNVHRMVQCLRDAGHITYRPNVARSIQLPKAEIRPEDFSDGLRDITKTTSLKTAQTIAAALLTKLEAYL